MKVIISWARSKSVDLGKIIVHFKWFATWKTFPNQMATELEDNPNRFTSLEMD